VLLGEHTAQSAGDFVSGPSHTLPTSAAARFASPLNVLDFLKLQSVARLDREDLAHLGPAIAAFSEMEGFPMHGLDASERL
jgi:histidinol dehydrogenase